MTTALNAIVVDCADPERVSAFWAEALGWKVRRDQDGDLCLSASGDPSRRQDPPAAPASRQRRLSIALLTRSIESSRRTWKLRSRRRPSMYSAIARRTTSTTGNPSTSATVSSAWA